MTSMNSKLCLTRPNHDALVYFIDEKTGKEIGCFGGVGQGPEDMNPLPMYVGKSENGDTIILHDMNARNLRAYVVISQDTTFRFKQVFKKSLASPYWDGVSSGYLAMCRLDNGFYVGVYYIGIEHFYTLLDDDLNTVASFGKYPLKEFGEDAKALKQLMSFRGTLTSYKNSAFLCGYPFWLHVAL